MATKIGGDEGEPMSDINIVPFVDIILVVLIIFMITTPFIVQPSININLPKAVTGEDTTPSQFNITIPKEGSLMVNGNAVGEDRLLALAEESALSSPDIQAIISADQEVSHGRVIAIIDTIRSAGISRFAISTQRK